MSFSKEYQQRKDEFERYLFEYVCNRLTYPDPLKQAVVYSLQSGGKRLRPILLLEAIRMFGGKTDASAIGFACAIECIHTYSLIHDDLPCMDNDDFRRGQPTCHKKFGETTAVLAGDALLNLAYELIFAAIAQHANDSHYVEAGSAIAEAAGGNGMVGGQVCDVVLPITKQSVDYIYRNKTAALIKAAVHAGACIGKASAADMKAVDTFGEMFGYAFQLQDDILDGDEESDKTTYLGLYGIEKTKEMCNQKTESALAALSTIKNSAFLADLVAHFAKRTV